MPDSSILHRDPDPVFSITKAENFSHNKIRESDGFISVQRPDYTWLVITLDAALIMEMILPIGQLIIETLKDRSRRPDEGEWEPIKISSKFESSAYIPKSPKPSSVLTKVWSSYWKANPTQKASNERAKPHSKSEANRENCRTDLPGPVWPVRWTGLTGALDRSDRSCLPVWPVAPRKPPKT